MLKTFKIGNVLIGRHPVIIAEAGVNHNGSHKLAEELIKKAAEAGAHFIKFQSYKAKNLVIKKSPRFWNWSGEKNKKGTQYDSYKNLDSFNYNDYKILMDKCKKYKIEFLTTPFDTNFVNFFDKMNIKAFKVASCDLNNFILLESIAKTRKPIFLSTGASTIQEIKDTLKFLKLKKAGKVIILHCTLSYPTKIEDFNIGGIHALQSTFKGNFVGLSDHTLGIDMTIAAAIAGAKVIEKHYTVDKKLKISADHWLSIDPLELKKLVKASLLNYKSLIKPERVKLKSEEITRKNARRSLVSSCYIKKDTILKKEMLSAKRPGIGIPPSEINSIVGNKVKISIEKDTILKKNMLKKIK